MVVIPVVVMSSAVNYVKFELLIHWEGIEERFEVVNAFSHRHEF